MEITNCKYWPKSSNFVISEYLPDPIAGALRMTHNNDPPKVTHEFHT